MLAVIRVAGGLSGGVVGVDHRVPRSVRPAADPITSDFIEGGDRSTPISRRHNWRLWLPRWAKSGLPRCKKVWPEGNV
jgi:hypothetical protein